MVRNLFILLIAFILGLPGAYASSYGQVYQAPQPTKTTYVSASGWIATASTATDVMTIYGSSSKTVRILKVYVEGGFVSGSASSTAVYVNVVKRSTADSSGTSSAGTAIPLDSANASATATVSIYSANPTVGTGVGTVGGYYFGIDNLAATLQPVFDVDKYGQAVTLHGTSEGLAVTFNGTASTGLGTSPMYQFIIVWTEE